MQIICHNFQINYSIVIIETKIVLHLLIIMTKLKEDSRNMFRKNLNNNYLPNSLHFHK